VSSEDCSDARGCHSLRHSCATNWLHTLDCSDGSQTQFIAQRKSSPFASVTFYFGHID